MPRWLATRADKPFYYGLREEPIEMLFAAAAVISSGWTLVTVTYPSSIQSALTPPFQYLWAAYLCFGGLLILGGLSASTDSMQTRGTAVEKAGLTLVSLGSFIYGCAILATLGFASPFIVCLLLVIPLCFALRIKQINRLIASNKKMVREAKEVGGAPQSS